MPSLNLSVPHTLTRDEAADRVRRLIDRVKQQYGQNVNDLNESWNDNGLQFSFSAMGFSTSGTMAVEDNQVRIDSKIPLAAMMFRGRIEDAIREQLTRILRA